MTSFDYSQIPLHMDKIQFTFRSIFDSPSLTTKIKNTFLETYFLNYLNDKEFKNSEQGKYIVFIDSQYFSSLYEEELDTIEYLGTIRLLFKITEIPQGFYHSRINYHRKCNDEEAVKGHTFVGCTFSHSKSYSEEEIIYSGEYMVDTGNTFTELYIDKYIDYRNLRIISTSPPIVKEFFEKIKWIEIIGLDTGNGMITKMKIITRNPLYVRIGNSDFVPFHCFVCSIPTFKIGNYVCYPGRYFSKISLSDDFDYLLLGTNITNKFLMLNIPMKQTNKKLELEEITNSRMLIQKIDSEDEKAYDIVTIKPGLLLDKISENNYYTPTYDNLVLEMTRLNDGIYETNRYISLLCINNDIEENNYNQNSIGDGYYLCDENRKIIFLKNDHDVNISTQIEVFTDLEIYNKYCIDSYIKGIGVVFM